MVESRSEYRKLTKFVTVNRTAKALGSLPAYPACSPWRWLSI